MFFSVLTRSEQATHTWRCHLTEWVPIGPRFSNGVLQTLMVLLARRPPKVSPEVTGSRIAPTNRTLPGPPPPHHCNNGHSFRRDRHPDVGDLRFPNPNTPRRDVVFDRNDSQGSGAVPVIKSPETRHSDARRSWLRWRRTSECWSEEIVEHRGDGQTRKRRPSVEVGD